jgi:hypothetical protein
MSACDPTSIPFQGAVNEYLVKAKEKIGKMNGTLNGTDTSGTFDVNSPVGRVAGTYAVSGQTITITVTDKPMMLPCNMIEGFLKGALS